MRNATLLRDRLSRDSWTILSKMDVDQLVEENLPGFADALPALNQLINHLTAFGGLVAESMTRGPGWLFLDIGRRIDRIEHQVRLIDSLLVPVHPRVAPLLEAMLENYGQLDHLSISLLDEFRAQDGTRSIAPRSSQPAINGLSFHSLGRTLGGIDGIGSRRYHRTTQEGTVLP